MRQPLLFKVAVLSDLNYEPKYLRSNFGQVNVALVSALVFFKHWQLALRSILHIPIMGLTGYIYAFVGSYQCLHIAQYLTEFTLILIILISCVI